MTPPPTSSTGALLLAAILADPADDTVRLVYADWLQEHGDDARAEFIRVQIAWARSRAELVSLRAAGENHIAVQKETILLHARWRALFASNDVNQHVWMGPVHDVCRAGTRWAHYLSWFRRGFVERVTCPAADWLACADAIRAAHPVTRVTLTTGPHWAWCDSNGRSRRSPCVIGSTPMRLVGRKPMLVPYDAPTADRVATLLTAYWPGITFDLPPYPVEIAPLPPADAALDFSAVRDWMIQEMSQRMGVPRHLFTPPA